MLIAKISDHNVVHGFVFSAVEFAFLSLVLLPFSFFYLTHGRFWMGAAALGIVANGSMVTGLALRTIARGEKDIGVRQMFDLKGRTAIHQQYPSLSRDTVLLNVAILIPFLLVMDAVFETIIPRKQL